MAEFKIGDIIELEFPTLQNLTFEKVNLTRHTSYKILDKDINDSFYVMNNIGITTQVHKMWMKKVENKMTPKVGDKIIVEFEAQVLTKTEDFSLIKSPSPLTTAAPVGSIWIKNTSIKEILPKEFKVGDKVRIKHNYDDVAIIIAIDEDEAWVKFNDNSKCIFELKYIEHFGE